ncbi:MAG: sigma-70 family RNA polymerase sigma factor [Cyanobacteria bacterium J06626_23]
MATRQPIETVWRAEKLKVKLGAAQIKAQTLQLITTYQATADPKRKSLLCNRIAILNQGLVGTVARRYQDKCDTPLEDLKQIGFEGLLKAVENFDLATGHAFSSYAVPKIEGSIKHYLRDNRSLAKVPRRWGETADQARRVQSAIARAGREITVDQAATLGVGVTERRWEWIETATGSASTRSIEEMELFEVADESGSDAAEAELQSAAWDTISRALAAVEEPARTYLIEHYYHDLPTRTIATRHQQTKAIVEQAIADALQEMKHGLSPEPATTA